MPDRLTDERLDTILVTREDHPAWYLESDEIKSMAAELLELRRTVERGMVVWKFCDKHNDSGNAWAMAKDPPCPVCLRKEVQRLRCAESALLRQADALEAKLASTEAALDAYAKRLADSEALLLLNEDTASDMELIDHARPTD